MMLFWNKQHLFHIYQQIFLGWHFVYFKYHFSPLCDFFPSQCHFSETYCTFPYWTSTLRGGHFFCFGWHFSPFFLCQWHFFWNWWHLFPIEQKFFLGWHFFYFGWHFCEHSLYDIFSLSMALFETDGTFSILKSNSSLDDLFLLKMALFFIFFKQTESFRNWIANLHWMAFFHFSETGSNFSILNSNSSLDGIFLLWMALFLGRHFFRLWWHLWTATFP